MSIFSSILSAGTSILGGLMGKSSAEKSTKLQTQTNLESARLDREQQERFAREGIQWRAQDAKSAGIHPLFAMGATIPTFSPSAIGVSQGASGHMGDAMSQAGQNIGRAVSATATRAVRALSLERAALENELLKSRINLTNSQIGPPFPSASPGLIPGQGASNQIIDLPQSRTSPSSTKPWQEPGAIVDQGFAKTATGYAPVPSQDVKERIEDQIIPEMMWNLRNYGKANIGKGSPPPNSWKPPGTKWSWSHLSQEWQIEPAFSRRPSRAPARYPKFPRRGRN